MKTSIQAILSVAFVAAVFFTAAMSSTAEEVSFTEDLKEVAFYAFGQSDAALRRIENRLYHGAAAGEEQAALLAGYEAQILSLLQEECSPEGRRFLCRFLADIGGKASIPVLGTMLSDAAQFQLAVSALEKFNDDEAARALAERLADAGEKDRIILLEALGRQKVASSAAAVQPYLAGSAQESLAAVNTLAAIGTAESCGLAAAAIKSADPAKQILWAAAGLICAEQLGASGDFSLLEIYKGTTFPVQVRIAALHSLIRLQPDKAEEYVVEGLQDGDADLASDSLSLARTVNGAKITDCLFALLDAAPDAQKPAYLEVLGVHGGQKVLDKAVSFAGYAHLNTRLAALKTVGVLGDASFVPFFLQQITAGGLEEQRTAKEMLTVMQDGQTDQTLLDTAVSGEDVKLRAAAIEMLSERRAVDTADALCALAYDAPAEVRNEAVHALRILGKPSMTGQMLFLSLIPGLSEVKSVLPQTIAALVQRGSASAATQTAAEKDAPVARFYNELKELQKKGELPADTLRDAACLVLDTFALLGDDLSFTHVKEALDDSDTEVRKAALGAITKFQRADALDALQRRITEEKEDGLRSLAYSSYLNVLKNATVLPGRVIDAHLDYAFEHAKNTSERREFLAAAAKAPSIRALQLAESLLKDPETAGEATRATASLAIALCGAWPQEAAVHLNAIAASDAPAALKTNVEKARALMSHFGNYLMAWEYAGPYFEENLMASHLYEKELLPQKDAENAPWKTLPMLIDSPLPVALEFDRIWGGEERVVFVRTLLKTATDQDLILAVGSNDGCRIWLNGKEIFAIADGRPLVPDENKIPVHLSAGENRLMMAVYQQGGAWRATARLTDLSGAPAQGVEAKVQ